MGSRLVSRWGLVEAKFREFRDPRNAAPGWAKLILSPSGANHMRTLSSKVALRMASYSFTPQRLGSAKAAEMVAGTLKNWSRYGGRDKIMTKTQEIHQNPAEPQEEANAVYHWESSVSDPSCVAKLLATASATACRGALTYHTYCLTAGPLLPPWGNHQNPTGIIRPPW